MQPYCHSQLAASNGLRSEQSACFDLQMSALRFGQTVTGRCLSTVAQPLRMLDQHVGDPRKHMSTTNLQPHRLQYQHEESSNIYTEPTVIEPNEQLNLTPAALAPLPPLLPPPIFAASNLEAATTNSSIFNEPSTNNCANVSDQWITDRELAYCNLEGDQNGQNKHLSPGRTITGHDLAITLTNGQITQTVLQNAVNHMENGHGHQLHSCHQQQHQRMELLPLCDLLFNIISLVAYFSDILFDLLTAYTLYLNEHYFWLVFVLTLIFGTTALCQMLSYKWHLRACKLQQNLILSMEHSRTNAQGQTLVTLNEPQSSTSLILIHICFVGVLWRYINLFLPVNLATVKCEVRDLCVLRMVHAFCQAGPMLLLQLYLLWQKPSSEAITELNITCIFLSLFSLCWAMSSFNKNIRQIHKLVLTWSSVICQFFWRLGTITSRVVSLTIYATVYKQWMLAVLLLHWFSMLLCLLSPTLNAQAISDHHGSTISKKKLNKKERFFQAVRLAWVYIFCFVNMENSNSRFKMTAYYCTMLAENVLLLSLALLFDARPVAPWYHTLVLYLMPCSFLMGMFFMWLYYRFFHVRYLKCIADSVNFEANCALNLPSNYSLCKNTFNKTIGKSAHESAQCSNGCPITSTESPETNANATTKRSSLSRLMSALSGQCFPSLYTDHVETNMSQTVVEGQRHHFNNEVIPGVFNCRLNPALKRKKKKPSTVPPPPQSCSVLNSSDSIFVQDAFAESNKQPLETIDEALISNDHSFKAGSNTQICQSSADTFWRKSSQSGRSLSISPSVMCNKSQQGFRFSRKHPFSSTITTPTSPANLLPTENFTDKLELGKKDTGAEIEESDQLAKRIIRPKPIVQQSINIDALENSMQPQQQQQQLKEGELKYDAQWNKTTQVPVAAPVEVTKDIPETIISRDASTLLHYYYHPYSRKIKLRSQTPEVLFLPHGDDSRVFYNYPCTVISAQTPAIGGQVGDFLEGQLNKAEDDDAIFTRQCKRPPVPGREGDDKSEENDNDNSKYMEGKLSLLNCDIDRARLKNILVNQQQQPQSIEEALQKSHISALSKTLPTERNSKPARYLVRHKKKYSSNKSKKRRSNVRHKTQYSSHSSSVSDFGQSSSGDDGDIESDINQQEHKLSHSSFDTDGISGLYGQVQNFTCQQGMLGQETEAQLVTHGAAPHIIRGPARLYESSQTSQSCDSRLTLGSRIVNYHGDLNETKQNLQNLRNKKLNNQSQPMTRPRLMYNSVKYKRHNTPL